MNDVAVVLYVNGASSENKTTVEVSLSKGWRLLSIPAGGRNVVDRAVDSWHCAFPAAYVWTAVLPTRMKMPKAIRSSVLLNVTARIAEAFAERRPGSQCVNHESGPEAGSVERYSRGQLARNNNA